MPESDPSRKEAYFTIDRASVLAAMELHLPWESTITEFSV